MQTTREQFDLYLAPSVGSFLSILVPFWLLSGVLCALCAGYFFGGGGLAVLIFPVLPLVLTILLSNRLMAKCTLVADENGLSMDIAPGSLILKSGLKRWTWDEVLKFRETFGRFYVLYLWCAGQRRLQLSGSDYDRLCQYLKTHFPEKEKKGWW